MIFKYLKRFAFSKLVLFFCLILNQNIFAVGFLAGTLIKTEDSYKPIEQLKENDLVISYSFKNKFLTHGKITKIQKNHYTSCIKLIISGKEIIVAPDHKFFCPLHKKLKWIQAKDLKQNDFISSNLTECIRVDVVPLNQEGDFYCLTIDKYKNYFVSEDNIFVHNIVPIAAAAAGGGLEFVIGSIGGMEVVGTVGGAGIAGLVSWALGKIFGGSTAKADWHDCGYTLNGQRIMDLTSIGAGIYGGKTLYDAVKNEVRSKNEKAPGKPTEQDGFEPKKNWDGKKKKHEKSGQHGWPDKNGNIWIPTGENGHGGPHWDVQNPKGGYDNILPGGKIRGNK